MTGKKTKGKSESDLCQGAGTVSEASSPSEVRATRSNGRFKISTINNSPSMTKQSFKAESDINFIVSRFRESLDRLAMAFLLRSLMGSLRGNVI